MRTILIALLMTLATQVGAQSTLSMDTYFEGKEVKIGEQIICEESEAR